MCQMHTMELTEVLGTPPNSFQIEALLSSKHRKCVPFCKSAQVMMYILLVYQMSHQGKSFHPLIFYYCYGGQVS